MPGDLNVKKSWHPGLAKNRLKVEQAEKSAVEDFKSKEARAAEIAKTRELEELRALQTGTPAKVGWLYDSNQPVDDSLNNQFRSLLKKKPKKKKMEKPEKPVKADKSRADPMAEFLTKSGSK